MNTTTQLLQFEDIHASGKYIAVATSGDLFRASYSEKHKNMFFAIPSTYQIAGYRPADLAEGDRVRVHLYDGSGREIVTRHFGDVFTVRRESGRLGIDWNTERSPYTSRGEVFSPFSTFAPSVIFEQIGTGYKFYWDNLANSIKRKERPRHGEQTTQQEEHNMKTAGYWACRNEIIAARLAAPHRYEPFTELFDVAQLDAIRDKYGVDLYRECYADALHEVTEAANITTHLRALGVECKPIFTPDDCHVNYIAVFSLGSTTAQRINEIARKADLCVLFQCPTH